MEKQKTCNMFLKNGHLVEEEDVWGKTAEDMIGLGKCGKTKQKESWSEGK